MPLQTLKVLSEQLWVDALIMVLIDTALIVFLTWRIKRHRFRELRWILVGTASIFWSVFGLLLVSIFWDTYYQYFYPGWLRSGGILLFMPILYGGLAFVFHWLSLRLPGNPILSFCLLGGLHSVLEHLWGIYGLKILEIPMLQGVDPTPILAFAFPEYIFYWSIVISFAVLFQNGWRWWIWRRGKGAKLAA